MTNIFYTQQLYLPKHEFFGDTTCSTFFVATTNHIFPLLMHHFSHITFFHDSLLPITYIRSHHRSIAIPLPAQHVPSNPFLPLPLACHSYLPSNILQRCQNTLRKTRNDIYRYKVEEQTIYIYVYSISYIFANVLCRK